MDPPGGADHAEQHFVTRIRWLRATVLGANDGVVSTASLIVGVAAAGSSEADILLAGTAGLVAGAMSMAAGEYVSVSAQADSEKADLDRERRALAENPDAETAELAAIYEGRGLAPALAREVAKQLMRHDGLGAHARDELGISDTVMSQPVLAAASSAAAFIAGAALPLVSALLAPQAYRGNHHRRLAAGAGATGGAVRALGRRDDLACGAARHLLGRGGDGRHGGDRDAVRNGGRLSRRRKRDDPRGAGGRERIRRAWTWTIASAPAASTPMAPLR